ncbi:MAG: hypothetical protein KME64_17395 [Scytonematopsis contorta HA4267-MV1]|jgi:hypothetical protein|nr:hypothetical protein [Scytonematopsis contorta HA4267-MV1]
MKKTVQKLRALFSLLLLQQHRQITLHLPLAKVRQLLIYFSQETIIEEDRHSIFSIFGQREIKYFFKIINDDCFQINGPEGYKRTCLLTQGRVISNPNASNEVVVDLQFQTANKLYICFTIAFPILLSIILILSIFNIKILFLIIVTWIPCIWCIASIADFLGESSEIIKLLRRKFNNLS